MRCSIWPLGGCAQLAKLQAEALACEAAPRHAESEKAGRARRILSPLLAVEVLGLDDVPPYDEVPETGATFTDMRCSRPARRCCIPDVSVADDSGLAIDALNGMPGVLSARWRARARATAAKPATGARTGWRQHAGHPVERVDGEAGIVGDAHHPVCSTASRALSSALSVNVAPVSGTSS